MTRPEGRAPGAVRGSALGTVALKLRLDKAKFRINLWADL
jgi:hypothetical protein